MYMWGVVLQQRERSTMELVKGENQHEKDCDELFAIFFFYLCQCFSLFPILYHLIKFCLF